MTEAFTLVSLTNESVVFYSSTLVFHSFAFAILKPCTMTVMNRSMLNECKWFSCKEFHINGAAQTTKWKAKGRLTASDGWCTISYFTFLVLHYLKIILYNNLNNDNNILLHVSERCNLNFMRTWFNAFLCWPASDGSLGQSVREGFWAEWRVMRWL